MALKQQFSYTGRNALRLYDTSEGSATLLSGFDALGTITSTVTGANQSLVVAGVDDGVASKQILFPFVGAKLIASADFSAITNRFNIGIRFLTGAGVEISRVQNDYVAGGRRSVEATVPATTVYVQWITTANEANAEWTFTRPALRTNSASYSD